MLICNSGETILQEVTSVCHEWVHPVAKNAPYRMLMCRHTVILTNVWRMSKVLWWQQRSAMT